MSIIGDGNSTTAWDDKWLRIGQLNQVITPRMFNDLDLTIDSSVADLLVRLQDEWPNGWTNIWPALVNERIPTIIHGKEDIIQWVDRDSARCDYSVATVWKTMDGPYEKVDWFNMCWFSDQVPKHGFCCWLAFQYRLPTQDRILAWRGAVDSLSCPLCNTCTDSHSHLFFSCIYSNQIWIKIRDLIQVPLPDCWDDIMDDIHHNRWVLRSLSQKLFFQAAVYHIWKERNARLFGNRNRSVEVVIKEVVNGVDMQLKAKRRRMITHNHDD